MPHLFKFTQICRKTMEQIWHIFATMVILVNATFASNILLQEKGICKGRKYNVKIHICKYFAQSGKCDQSIVFEPCLRRMAKVLKLLL